MTGPRIRSIEVTISRNKGLRARIRMLLKPNRILLFYSSIWLPTYLTEFKSELRVPED